MADETKLGQNDLQEEPKELEIEELNEGDLDGVSGGLFSDTEARDTNDGCTVNNATHC